MWPMWLCIFSGRQFEETFENTRRRKIKQMQPVWLCIFSGRPFANAPWGKARRFEDTFEKSLNKCNQRNFASYRVDHLQMHHGEKPNKWLQPIWLCLYRADVCKCIVEKSQTNVTSVTLHRQFETHGGEKFYTCSQCEYAATCASECKQMQPVWISLFQASDLRRHLETHRGDKQNKCNQCDYAPSQAEHLWIHL